MKNPILHQASWAQSRGGKAIELYQNQPSSQGGFLLVGGVHGDEPEGVEIAKKLLLHLQKSHNSIDDSWILIPCLNIDGYLKNERTNSAGVDLNRNFPTRDWSNQAQAPRYFPGPTPGSEPEVQALTRLIQEQKPQLIVHFHSWKPCVVYTGAPGRPWAELLATGSGYEVHEDIGYPTPGSLGQYGWLEHQTPVVCLEADDKSPLHEVWPRFETGLKALFHKK